MAKTKIIAIAVDTILLNFLLYKFMLSPLSHLIMKG